MIDRNYPAEVGGQAMLGKHFNPTVAENIDAKIKFHFDEIERLQRIKEAIPASMLEMNLHDMQKAFSL